MSDTVAERPSPGTDLDTPCDAAVVDTRALPALWIVAAMALGLLVGRATLHDEEVRAGSRHLAAEIRMLPSTTDCVAALRHCSDTNRL